MTSNPSYEKLRFLPYKDLKRARAYLKGKKARHRGEPVTDGLMSKQERLAWLRGYLLSTEYKADRELTRPNGSVPVGAGIGPR